MSFLPVSQTMALPHGDLSVNQDFVGVMDNPVQNGLCNSAAFLRIRMQPLVSVSRLVLGAEDHRAFITPCLNHFQQVITFLRRQTSDQPFIQNQKIILLVALNGLLQLTCGLSQGQFLQKLWESDVPHRQQLSAGGIAHGTGEVGLAVAGGSLENNVVALGNEVTGGKP